MKIFLIPVFLIPLISQVAADDHLTTERVMEFLERRLPAAVERLENIRRHEPADEYAEALAEASELVAEFREISREESEEEAEAFLNEHRRELHIENLVAEFHENENPERREKIRAHVREVIQERFEVEIVHLKEGRDHLKFELRELEEELAERTEARKEIIAEEMERFFEEEEGEEGEDDDDDDDEDEDDDDDDDEDDD